MGRHRAGPPPTVSPPSPPVRKEPSRSWQEADFWFELFSLAFLVFLVLLGAVGSVIYLVV